MKKSIIFIGILIASVFVSCGNSIKNDKDNEIDSIAAKLSLIDSLQNSGTYSHLESWDMGRIVDNRYKRFDSIADDYSVDVYVNRLSYKTDTLYYLQLSYMERSQYSSKREAKIVDLKELKSFYAAIDDIKKQYGRDTDHFERYLYLTKSDASLFLRRLINSDYWELEFCSIEISKDDLDELKKLLKKSESKAIELQKAAKK